jgi:predicted ATP-dependent Lon-type protease
MTDAIAERVIRTDITMAVAARDGQIHMLFNEQNQQGESVPAYTPNFLLSASDALVFSTLLADLAFEAETSLKPAGDVVKAELMERHRVKLVDRLSVMLNSTREKKTTSNRGLAKQMVDVMMAEVFS